MATNSNNSTYVINKPIIYILFKKYIQKYKMLYTNEKNEYNVSCVWFCNILYEISFKVNLEENSKNVLLKNHKIW